MGEKLGQAELVFRLSRSDSAMLSRAKRACGGILEYKLMTNWLNNAVIEQW
jgi:hypothetical protein